MTESAAIDVIRSTEQYHYQHVINCKSRGAFQDDFLARISIYLYPVRS